MAMGVQLGSNITPSSKRSTATEGETVVNRRRSGIPGRRRQTDPGGHMNNPDRSEADPSSHGRRRRVGLAALAAGATLAGSAVFIPAATSASASTLGALTSTGSLKA